MASGEWAVVCGAAIGVLGTLGSTYLSDHLNRRKQVRIDKDRKNLLRKALSGAGPQGWMRIETLARLVGADLDTTRALLIEISARGSLKNDKEMWSLISRNPLPTGTCEE